MSVQGRKKISFRMGIGVALSAIFLAAGGSQVAAKAPSAAQTTVGKLPAGTKIGIAMREMVNGYDNNIAVGVKVAAAAAGATTIVTDAGGSEPKQITQIRSLINSGVKGIVIGLGTASALAPVVAEARAKGIVVTSAAIGVPIPGALADVSGNEFLIGTLGASMLLQYIHFSGTIYALSVPGAPVLDARLNALLGMAKSYPDVTINVIPTTFSPAKVYSQVQAVLAAHPSASDIAAIWVAYDQLSTGATQAVIGSHRTIPVFSEDGDVPGFKMLFQPGSPFMGTVADDSATMGKLAGEYLIKGLFKKTAGIVPETFGPAFSVTRNNLVAAAELQFGKASAWKQLGTTPAKIAARFPQNQQVTSVTPLIVQHP